MKLLLFLSGVGVLAACTGSGSSRPYRTAATPPQTRVEPVTETIHGVSVVDNYRWLEGDNTNAADQGQVTPEVAAWTDYIVATGVSHSVEDLVRVAFHHVGLEWTDYVRSDPSFGRGAAELYGLVGDASKAHRVLGWTPEVSFEELIAMLVDADIALLSESAPVSEQAPR